jgi:hypothetical protein
VTSVAITTPMRTFVLPLAAPAVEVAPRVVVRITATSVVVWTAAEPNGLPAEATATRKTGDWSLNWLPRSIRSPEILNVVGVVSPGALAVNLIAKPSLPEHCPLDVGETVNAMYGTDPFVVAVTVGNAGIATLWCGFAVPPHSGDVPAGSRANVKVMVSPADHPSPATGLPSMRVSTAVARGWLDLPGKTVVDAIELRLPPPTAWNADAARSNVASEPTTAVVQSTVAASRRTAADVVFTESLRGWFATKPRDEADRTLADVVVGLVNGGRTTNAQLTAGLREFALATVRECHPVSITSGKCPKRKSLSDADERN